MSCYAVSSIGSSPVTATSWIARPIRWSGCRGLFMARSRRSEHHVQVVIYQDEAHGWRRKPRFSYIEDRNKQQSKM